jgi:hypothetical protein
MSDFYDIGDTTHFTATFLDLAGDPIDQTSISANVLKPSGGTVSYLSEIVRATVGVYTLDFTVDEAGEWSGKFIGDTDVIPFGFYVRADDTISPSDLYVTRDELKTALSLSGQTYADQDIDLACEAASRGIDQATGRFFYTNPNDEIRYYSANPNDNWFQIDDVLTLTSLEVDTSGDGSFSTLWVEDTDFHLEPYNAPLHNQPFTDVRIIPSAGRKFPAFFRNIRATGQFGWLQPPPEVRQYAKIFAAKLLLRSRQAPFGVISYGMDQPIAVHITRHDPDFERMLGHLVRVRLFI